MLLYVVELKGGNKKITLGESLLLSRSWQSRTSFVFISNLLLRRWLLILACDSSQPFGEGAHGTCWTDSPGGRGRGGGGGPRPGPAGSRCSSFPGRPLHLPREPEGWHQQITDGVVPSPAFSRSFIAPNCW